MTDLLIHGGTVVTSTAQMEVDLAVDGGKIVWIGSNYAGDRPERVIDARGLLVLPGLIDPHVHFQLPFFGTVTRHDFFSGTVAAAFGGVTTVVDFAFQERGGTAMDAIQARRAEADGHACIDYSLHAVFTDVNHETPLQLEELVEAGIATWKVFMAYRREGVMVDDGGLFALLEAGIRLPCVGIVHAENAAIIELLVDRFLAAGKTDTRYHALSRPPLAEAEATGRAVRQAGAANCPLYVFHVSSADALAEIRTARNRGWPIYGETCPHYLCLDASLYDRPDGYNWCMSPPLRAQADRDALWRALADGALSVVSTDDAAFDAESKKRGEESFTRVPNGIPGVETRLSILYSEGVAKGRINVQRLVALTSTNPARLAGLYPQKGNIAVGADADLVLFNPSRQTTLSLENSHMLAGWHPYEGTRVMGVPVMTIAGGEVIVEAGEFKGKEGAGRFIRRRIDPEIKRGPVL